MAYVHGYNEREEQRLQDQARTLVDLLHADTFYPAGSKVLEAGCGTGAQTLTLALKSPEASITSIDISAASIDIAKATCRAAGITNVAFLQADLLSVSFEDESFDHVFLCFVLEHLPKPELALKALKRLIRPGGTITVIEGDHGSAHFHPDSVFARRAINCQVELQARSGGDANIGRRLYPLLTSSGFDTCALRVVPRLVYVDGSRPDWIEGFTKNTFITMIEGVKDQAVSAGLMTQGDFDKGLFDLRQTATADGVFCYTFFKATAEV